MRPYIHLHSILDDPVQVFVFPTLVIFRSDRHRECSVGFAWLTFGVGVEWEVGTP